jgi:dihydropteroate synthase
MLFIIMTDHSPTFVEIKTLQDAEKEIQRIGSDPQSISIMAPKAVSKNIKLENVTLQDAIIIKQDMLSVGGEVAVPRNTFELHDKTGDLLIMGNLKQLYDLIEKLDRHYPRLKNIAKELAMLLKDVK